MISPTLRGVRDSFQAIARFYCRLSIRREWGGKTQKSRKVFLGVDYRLHAIFYRIRDNDIFILRILHHKMEPLVHFSEL